MNELLQTLVTGAITGSLYGLIAVGFTVAYEATGIINFAQGDLVGLGAYIIFEGVAAGWPLPLAVLVGVAAVGLGMALFERLVLRRLVRRGIVLAVIATIGLSGALESIIQEAWGPAPIGVQSVFSSSTWHLGAIRVSPEQVFALLLSLLLTLCLYLAIERTRFGRGLRAMARDRTVAALLGIRQGRMALAGFGIAGGIAAIAGLLLGPIVGLTPDMGLNLGVIGFSGAAVGGFGSVNGALMGGVVIGLGESLIGAYVAPDYINAFAYICLVLVLIVRPQGLLGERQAAIRNV